MKSLAHLPRVFSRRGFFAAVIALFAALSSKVRGHSLRRRKGDPAPSGWFGHC